MKGFLPYCILLLLLQCLLRPTTSYAQNHDADSLRQVMRLSPGDPEGLHASVLLAQEMLPEQMDSARILLELAQSLEHSTVLRHQAQYHNVWGLYYWFKRDRQASIENYKKTIALPGKEEILSLQAAAANNVGGHYFRLGEPDSSRVYLVMALEIDQARGHKTGMAKTYFDLSGLHRSLDQHELALRYINEAIRIQEIDGDKERLIHSYTLLGNIFTSLMEAKKASSAYEHAQELARELGRQRSVILLYGNLSAVWCMRDDGLEKTIHYFESGITEARELGQPDLVAVLLGNMGAAWLTAGEAGRALGYFEEALDLAREAGCLSSEMQILYRLGQSHGRLGQWQQARQHLESSLALARRLQSPHNQSRALLEIASLDSLKGDYRRSLEHYTRGVTLRDSVWSRENRSRIAELQILHETEQNLLRIAELEAREKVVSIRQRSILAVGLLIISLLVIALLYIQKRRLASHQKLIIREQEKERIETELETNRRELTGKALSLARSDQVIQQLKTDIQAVLSRSDNKSCDELRSALQMLKSSQNSSQLWKEFEIRFNELNEGFINRLTTAYPGLSMAEIRLCAMLRLQMTTKDIAEMINRSTRTIEHTRNKVRKKMNLSPGDNLLQHLLNI